MRRLLFWGALLILLALSLIFLLQKRTYLLAHNADAKEIYATHLPTEGRFCIKFTHSVALSPVEEWYRAENEHIVLTSTVYEDFGAGLPHDTAPGQHMFVEDGKVHITGFTLSLRDLQVRVGRIANHELIVERNKEQALELIPLSFFALQGKTVIFSIQEVSWFMAMMKNWKKIPFHS